MTTPPDQPFEELVRTMSGRTVRTHLADYRRTWRSASRQPPPSAASPVDLSDAVASAVDGLGPPAVAATLATAGAGRLTSYHG
jgi:hypothetical protein